MNVIFAGLLAIATTATAGSAGQSSDYVVMKNGSVETFYGVPKTLKLSDVRSLPFPHKEGAESGGEGTTLRTAIISGRNNVKITVVFDRRGQSVEVKTASRQARDPRGVKVGDKLSHVQKVWPEGKLYYGASIEGGRPYAIFMTGTNVILDLSDNVHDMKRAPSRVRVEEIKIVGYKATL